MCHGDFKHLDICDKGSLTSKLEFQLQLTGSDRVTFTVRVAIVYGDFRHFLETLIEILLLTLIPKLLTPLVKVKYVILLESLKSAEYSKI